MLGMDEAAFLAAILADPSDDAPRLVFAEWLEEHGQEERGEFIRVQVELERKPPINTEGRAWNRTSLCDRPKCDTCPLVRRERELLTADWRQLAPDFPLPMTRLRIAFPDGHAHVEWSRGFIGAVHCSAADWLAHADAILAAQPVRSVTLTTWPEIDDGVEMAGCIRLANRTNAKIIPVETLEIGDSMSLACLRAEWPEVMFHLPADRWGSFDVPVYDPAAHVVPTL